VCPVRAREEQMLAVLLDADESQVLHLELLTTHAAYQGPPPASWGSTLPC